MTANVYVYLNITKKINRNPVKKIDGFNSKPSIKKNRKNN